MRWVAAPAPHCYIVAEIGINHNGDLGIARRLIDLAVETGCDAVKFQKRTINRVYTAEVLDSPRESPWGMTQRDQKEGLEFGREEYDQVDAYCKERGIEWFGSAWDAESLEFLASYGPPHHKVASAMLTHWEFVEHVAKTGVHTFVSTGMSGWEEIDRAVEIFKRHDCPFTLMHTVATYPMADEEANLAVMEEMAGRYGVPVGFSSHEVGLICTVVAAALGAVSVERHITLDRAMYGSDQAASIEKPGLERLVRDIRLLPQIYGTGEKRITAAEEPLARKLRYFAKF